AREVDDLRQLALDLAAAHAEDRAVEEDVLAPRELGMESGSDLEQAADASPDHRATLRRRRDPRQDLQQRRLAGAVPTDDAEHLALVELERHVLERPDVLALTRVLRSEEPLRGVRGRFAEGAVRGLKLADAVPLRKIVGFDRDRHQIVSAK